MVEESRMDWVVCGRKIGTGTGWDQSDNFALMIYDFEPVEGCSLPKADCITIHFEHGTVETHKDDGEVDVSVDLIDAIKDLPKTSIW